MKNLSLKLLFVSLTLVSCQKMDSEVVPTEKAQPTQAPTASHLQTHRTQSGY